MSQRETIASSLKKEGRNRVWSLQFIHPTPTLPSITITINAKEETDIPHVGEQLWVGSLVLAEYLLNQ